MRLTRRVRLGASHLDAVDTAVVIRSIDPGTPARNISTAERRGLFGPRITARSWGMLECRVTYAINIPKKEMARRREVFDAVNKWANAKGWMIIQNIDARRRMYVDEVILPDAGDLWNRNAEFTILFQAYNVPFWQGMDDISGAMKLKAETEKSMTLEVDGTAPTVLDIKFKNTSNKEIENFSVVAGGNRLTLNGVKLAANETLNISHEYRSGILSITADKESGASRDLYPLLTGADDLIINPGNREIRAKASRAGELTATCRARWL